MAHRGRREVALWKPPGLSCELPGAARARSWIAAIEAAFGHEVRLCHRLDRIARGLVLVALDREAAAWHAERFRARQVLKGYLVRVRGIGLESLVGEHRAYLRRVGRTARVVRSGGDPASLAVLAVADAVDRPGESHLLIRLESGRFHQIRAMLAHLGHPLAGDVDYGGSAKEGPPYLESAVLGFDPADGGSRITLDGERSSPREAIAPAVAAALRRLVDSDRASR